MWRLKFRFLLTEWGFIPSPYIPVDRQLAYDINAYQAHKLASPEQKEPLVELSEILVRIENSAAEEKFFWKDFTIAKKNEFFIYYNLRIRGYKFTTWRPDYYCHDRVLICVSWNI